MLWATAAVLGIAVLYVAFELGRFDAGFRVIDSVRGALAASARIRELESENDDQRRQLAAADVARRVDREGYKQVERSLGDMQSQIARLNQDLSFYRGLVQPVSLIHVKVQQMQIVPDAGAPGAAAVPGAAAPRGAAQYHLKFVLIQSGKPDSVVSGTAAIVIDGLLPRSLLLDTVARVSSGGARNRAKPTTPVMPSLEPRTSHTTAASRPTVIAAMSGSPTRCCSQ